MRARRPLRSAFVVTVGGASALLGACGGIDGAATADGGTGDGGSCQQSRNPPAPVCPPVEPARGSTCECFPGGSSCTYASGMCNGQPISTVAMCIGGAWQIAVSTCNPPGMPPPDSGVDASDAGDASIDAQHTD